GWAWAMGYIGGLGCLAAALVLLIGFGESPGLLGLPEEDAVNIRATALLVALWFAVFALPLFLFTPDAPATGIGARAAVRTGLATLWQTLREVRRYGQILRFLIA